MQEREDAAREAASILAKALSEAQALLAGGAEAEAGEGRRRREARREGPLSLQAQTTLGILADYFGRTVDLIGEERQLLAEQVNALTEAVQRLDERFEQVARLLEESRGAEAAEAPKGKRPRASERAQEAFAVGGEGVQLVLSAVPGFQELMGLQRALMRRKGVERASVERYFDGEARVILVLREPLTAGDIVDAIGEGAGHQLAVEEARPEALRLHLRFLEGES
jgi:hypothetical protein